MRAGLLDLSLESSPGLTVGSQKDADGSVKLTINYWEPLGQLKVIWPPCGEETDDKVEERLSACPFLPDRLPGKASAYPITCGNRQAPASWWGRRKAWKSSIREALPCEGITQRAWFLNIPLALPVPRGVDTYNEGCLCISASIGVQSVPPRSPFPWDGVPPTCPLPLLGWAQIRASTLSSSPKTHHQPT